MPTFSIQFKAMGSHMQAWLSAPSAEEAQILAAVPAWFEEWEQILSRFRPTSELSALNAHSGEWFKASPILYEVVADAREASEFSNGVFNPLVLNALEAAGYDRSFDKDAPDDDRPLSAAQSVPAWELIQLDDEREAILLPQGARIDLGGIGKGWAAQMAADKLAAYGPCLVDAGGDLAAHGSPDEQGGWVVNVPTLDESNTLMTLLLVDQAVATSGTDYRNWQRDGKQFHHLIDPRTGRPAQSDILRATVIAPDASEAVVWAKVSLITQQFSEYPTVFVYRDGRVQANLEVQFS
jgi:thiamine biosynthesis lipoprotein